MSTTSPTPPVARTPVVAAALPTRARADVSPDGSVQGDDHAGTVPDCSIGGYARQPEGLTQSAEGPAGFYFHDMHHVTAMGLPVVPFEHYQSGAGSAGYDPTSHTCSQATAQLLERMRRSAPPRETASQVFKALPAALSLPLDKTYDGTRQFIKDHPFFHQGLMQRPIGFGKHFRNVPFIGPARIIWGLVTLNRDEIAKGAETFRGTWDAA